MSKGFLAISNENGRLKRVIRLFVWNNHRDLVVLSVMFIVFRIKLYYAKYYCVILVTKN